jgi:hypothetical protein
VLRRRRLAAQRLAPATAAASPATAAEAVCGVQAQDVWAAALALRARVPGLDRAAVDGAPLLRIWTVRGTAHLIAAADRPWLHAVCAGRNRERFEGLLERRGGLALARALLPAMVDVLAERARDRPALLEELARRGHPRPSGPVTNVLVPWATQRGVVVGRADGHLEVAEPPPAIDPDEALATLARRYLAGYGPATAGDLARWSGLPDGAVRRALAALAPLDRAGDLLALPGALDARPPPAPPARLLPAFDTLMLGYARREPFVPAAHDARVLPGGGMLRPVVLARGVVAGTWRLAGAGRRRELAVDWFGRPAAPRALVAEARDVGRFLDLEIELA